MHHALPASLHFHQVVLIIFFICTIASGDICSARDFSGTIEFQNANVSCTTNMSCDAKCYRGYIFPIGSWKESNRCQNGVWTPSISTCKRELFAVHQFNCI